MKYVFLFLLFSLCFFSCKKDSHEASFPAESNLKLSVDNVTYEYAGKELGGNFAQGTPFIPATFMMYTTGSTTKPGFYIMGHAPGLTTVGNYLVVSCNYNVSNNGPYYHQANSLDPSKSKLKITGVSVDELKFKGDFGIQVIDSTTNQTKEANGSFAIIIQ